MDTTGFNPKLGSDSQDSDDLQQPAPPGVERPLIKFATKDIKLPKASLLTPLGVENAKKRLRAFSIQKKTSLSPVPIPKGSGAATVFIGKASGVKAFSKPPPEPSPDEAKKPPKPPKPGGATESYILNQKKTLAEIEDMKRKMELVELGIPLGLICPAPDSQWNKAMPTKAMPPIKTFLDRDKVDELIREGKKARAEGKEFKFDYRKLLPDYDNPFQRKKELQMAEPEVAIAEPERKSRDKDKRRSDRYDSKRRSSHKSDDKYRRRDDKYKDRSKDKISSRERDRSKEKPDSKHKNQEEKHKGRDVKPLEKDVKYKEYDKPKDGTKDKELNVKLEEATKETEKEAEVNLKDFVVCDSWSDNDDKSKDSTPKPEGTKLVEKSPLYAELDIPIDPMKQLRDSLLKKDKTSPKPKLKRLNPDAVKFEIVEPDEDDDVLDMFDESSRLEKFSQKKKDPEESSMDQLFDFDDEKDETFEGMADDTFLESVINEIKQEEIDENSHDKALVGYDESPSTETFTTRGSVTPEMDDKTRHLHSSRSNYSDGYKSTESGYKSTESVKMSDCDLETMVEDRKRELERMEEFRKINKCTEVSLNMWSFVLKVCQPILFRHDRNKCYKETRIEPKLWYTENPKLCNCVKDRSVVYEELDVYKRKYLGKLYGMEIPQDTVEAGHRGWYPSLQQWPTPPVQAASEWETEDSQAEQRADTPQHHHMLDEEYQRFMATVRPDEGDSKSGTPRSTPSRREASKKKSTEPVDDKNSKRMKMTSEGWSQESELEEEVDKSFTIQDYMFEAVNFTPNLQIIEKKVKEKRKRKHSTSTSVTDSSESEPKKKKKAQKKKDTKKSKLKDSKRRRVSKKNIKKLKEKQKKKKKTAKSEEDSDVQELEKAKKKKDKKLKKKKLLKQKKKTQKKKKSRAKKSSSDSSDSEPEKKSKKKKKGDKKKKKNKSDAQETQLFDVNILNNIKTERNSEEEQSQMEFSPRKPKVTREIINVKELQNDFVGNSIQIKKEVEENEKRNVTDKQEDSQESQVETAEKDSCDLKEEKEIQSTPQLRPDESNNSQCSSQESVYSLKDQHVYEKDESHLRPSSQNSNYSFHDVMASGKFSKKHVEQEKYGFENNSRSQESIHRDQDTRSQDRKVRSDDMRSQEQESRSQEHDKSHHDPQSREELRSHEQSYEYDQHSQQYEVHGIQRHIRDIPRPDSRSRDQDSRSHDPRSHVHESRSHEHDPRTYEHESRSHEVLNEHKVHDMPYKHDMPTHDNIQSHDVQTHADEIEYEQGNYEMYEQMAMAYQSDVANQHTSPPDGGGSRRIETVVRARTCGEIKCDWRAGAALAPPAPANRPSRWGLKPGEVNIVLTGGGQSPSARVYRIQSLANRTDTGPNTGYDEAYMDTYGAADRLQYGDCFSTESSERRNITPATSSLDDRINRVLRTTVLGEVAQDAAETEQKEREKGILVTKSLSVASRAPKRVSFADGYKPGQDSDVEEPPVKKKKKPRRLGCAWPCPASHPDHVPLWDALPPPPPPPGSPPPPTPIPPPPVHLLRQGRPMPSLLQAPPHHMFGNVVKMESMDEERKFDPTALPAFMPTEPPPGMLAFPNM